MRTGTKTPATRRRLLLLLLALGVLVLLGGGLLARHGLAAQGSPEVCRFCPAAARPPSVPRIERASPEQRALLRELVTKLAPSGLTLLRLGPRESKDWVELRSLGIEKPPGYVPPNHVGLKVIYERNHEPETRWRATLLAQAFHARSEQLGLPRVIWFEESDGGRTLTSWSGAEVEERSAPHGPKPLREAEIEALVETARAAVLASGAELRRLELLHPGGEALLLSLRTEDAHAFLRDRLAALMEAVQAEAVHTAGFYLELRDDEGIAWYTAQTETAHSMGGEGGPTREELLCVDPFFRGTLSQSERPACKSGARWLR